MLILFVNVVSVLPLLVEEAVSPSLPTKKILSITSIVLISEWVSALESVNESPYEKGWMIKVKASNLSEIDHLMDAETYKELIGH